MTVTVALAATNVFTDAEATPMSGWVSIADGTIVRVGPEPETGFPQRMLGDVDLIPGLVDLHADSLERFEHTRPGVSVPLPAALQAFADDAISSGITTTFLALTIETGTAAQRSAGHAEDVCRALRQHRATTIGDLRIHLRIDITDDRNVSSARQLLCAHHDLVGLISYMDHTPGQGQYRTEAAWRCAYARRDDATESVLDERLRRLSAGSAGRARRKHEISSLARQFAIPLASHDDEDAAAVADAHCYGATIAEFPLSPESAAAAAGAGMTVVIGAPNLWRGGSHGTGPSARTLAADPLTVITSDYHLGSVLPGIYAAADAEVATLPHLIGAASATPARAVGLADRGAIRVGHQADLVAVRRHPIPRVLTVWRAGEPVLDRS